MVLWGKIQEACQLSLVNAFERKNTGKNGGPFVTGTTGVKCGPRPSQNPCP
jgi:hypothetical protein